MKLLFVNGCISQRGEESRTLVLARTFLDRRPRWRLWNQRPCWR